MLHPRKSILASLACAALIAAAGTSAAQAAPRADDTVTEAVTQDTAEVKDDTAVTADAPRVSGPPTTGPRNVCRTPSFRS
ncbi:hypothetical protein [Rhodococcus sp. OK302]|uniref:hypothetical protein n=1 Tax=Rhodococcus sp. OK302 TaxID=1882769 RepID=UPI000B942D35|nr:hypothetical protein [Rhodococcus sp. OK302]OYD60750.1 hypothetical protein BDB13_5627 [Rhodococcus sp. OK302]